MSFIKNLIYKFLNKKISIIYNKRFSQHQNTPKGVFWNSKLSQDLRLNIILDKIIDNSKSDTFTIADIGCGYGRFFEIIKERNLQDKIKYSGFDINKNLSSFEIKISTIARGIPVGDELEYTDEITLGRSILKRIPYTDSV